MTGLSTQTRDPVGKRLQFLREIAPGLHRLAILFRADLPGAISEVGEVQTIARTLGLDVVPLAIRRAADIAPAFAALKGPADALYVVQDFVIAASRTRIIIFALTARLPTIFGTRDYVQFGGLMSYGPNYRDQFPRAAEYVDKILRGAKPGDIPVEQPTRFYLTINLATAEALNITVPPNLLALADEFIE